MIGAAIELGEGAIMAKSGDPREGGWMWNLFYKYWGGPAATQGAIQGFTEEARDGWKRDLENRKRWSREQREKAGR